MGAKSRGTYLIKTRLIKIYQRMKNNRDKLRMWVAYEFGQNNPRQYLETLVSLGIIKRVVAVYKIGGKNHLRKGVKGYKLI